VDDASWPPPQQAQQGQGAPGTGEAVPTCYRHPGREAHIRCVRCDRAICPDCMIPAAVGFQCPECVRRGHASQRVARTALGGRVAPNQTLVTYTLIGLNVVFFLVQQASPSFIDRFSLLPGPVFLRFGDQHLVGVAEGEYYRLVTALFLHAGVMHILFNMWALYVVGAPLEAMLGRLRFVALYFLSGLSGSALAYLLADPRTETVGASGAIFGLFGALFVVGRRLNLSIGPIGIVIALNLVLTFTISGISWQGHIGGLIAGAALAAAWVYAPRAQRTTAQVASSVLVAAVIVAMVVARTHALIS
jgi:membrane associated rhomboid family serine protease